MLNAKDLKFHPASFGNIAKDLACDSGKNIYNAVKNQSYYKMTEEELKEFTIKGCKLLGQEGLVSLLESNEPIEKMIHEKTAIMPSLGVAVAGMNFCIIIGNKDSKKALKIAKHIGAIIDSLIYYCVDNNNGREKFRREVLLQLLRAPFFEFTYLFGVVDENTIDELEAYLDKLRNQLGKTISEKSKLTEAMKTKLLWTLQVINAYEGKNTAVFIYTPFTKEEAGKLLLDHQRHGGSCTLRDFSCYETENGYILVPEKGGITYGKVYFLNSYSLLKLEQLKNPEDKYANCQVELISPLGKIIANTFIAISKPKEASLVVGWKEQNGY